MMHIQPSITQFSPQSETGPGEHLTKSRPISAPIKETKAAATAVSTGMRILIFVFMVMLQALYTSVITCAASLRLMVTGKADRVSWEGELRTAATLIPALLQESHLPVELSERRST